MQQFINCVNRELTHLWHWPFVEDTSAPFVSFMDNLRFTCINMRACVSPQSSGLTHSHLISKRSLLDNFITQVLLNYLCFQFKLNDTCLFVI